jgi:uncharacterized protein YprB with RNaseH-like and TPR domain
MIIFPAQEATSAKYYGTLLDESGTLVPGASLSSAILTLYDQNSGDVINSRSAQSVLNANNVTFYDTLQSGLDDDGNAITYNVLWTVQPGDVPIISTTLLRGKKERHIAKFAYAWGGTTPGAMLHLVALDVERLSEPS